ncbi:hypothetical protein [Fulvivirga lutea]|uniref:Lipocalin-like domain-containing protein n=1 Tax=Fulvivirga lutea TaxID=2810512 RepID=A0A975A1E2_9BACT|nr:hypothetical protein [Fulvivirga lutea]QSE97437.1 hypothetical protein JR347_17945 [Fulvivirga lutea]
MKRYIKLILTISVVALIGLLSGCDDDDSSDPVNNTEVERVFNLLSASGWNVSEVLVDDLDFSSTYAGLSLTFQEGTYNSVNGGAIFQSSGTWNFTSTSATQILLDGDLEMDVLEISENTLVVGLTWNQNTLGTGGRTASVSGNHVFTFTR